jgi:hypothetical protein
MCKPLGIIAEQVTEFGEIVDELVCGKLKFTSFVTMYWV